MADYFKKYLKIAPLSHALWRANEAYELEKSVFHPPVLDLGCGFGEFTGVFFGSQIKMGIDISKKESLQAIKTGKYKETLEADARHLPFPKNSFNTVISISTLEHIKKVEKVIPEVYRVLRKGGFFLFTVPTAEISNHLLFPRLFNWAFKHESMFPAETWKKMVIETGFEIQIVRGTISSRAVKVFELFLPLALPTQFSKALLGRRLAISPQWRVNILSRWFKPLIGRRDSSESNILIIARKPK
jgi:ubiquinone/menaquinone biosynthesis C-methylase UbiE